MNANWQKITEEVLEHFEMSEASLARALGCSQPSVHRLKNGLTKDPNFSLGAALLKLHGEATSSRDTLDAST